MRDPFLAAFAATKSLKNKKGTSLVTNGTVKTESPEDVVKPIWKGVVSSTEGCVVIISFKNKSYLLKVGSYLPGTGYRIVEINKNSVLLISPQGQLKLGKKEVLK